MGKGSSSPPTNRSINESTVTQSNLPAYAEPYFRQGLERSIFRCQQYSQKYWLSGIWNGNGYC